MYRSFRFAVLDKSVPPFLLPALAALTVLAITPAFAASGTGSNIDWLSMGMKLLGGLALFLYGMEQMADALKAAAGERMKLILAKLTTNRFMGAITGAFVTAIIQSSSVTTVLVVGFITAGLMSMAQSIPKPRREPASRRARPSDHPRVPTARGAQTRSTLPCVRS